MSYILDALRKSEEARQRQQGPDLSLAEPGPGPQRGRSSKALPLLALALLVNGAVLGIWLLRSGDPAPPEAHATAPIEARDTASAITSSNHPPSPHSPEAMPEAIFAPEPNGISIEWRQQPIMRLEELPSQQRSRFPRLAITTHIYADAPAFREVSINGRRYQEGDQVAGVVLLEITEAGVLMAFEGEVVRLDLQDEWSW